MTPFLISIPKAGTHIIRQATERVSGNIPYGSMIYEADPHELSIKGIREFNRIGISHLPYHPAYERELRNRQAKVVFLYRDPRDLMISYYFWIKKLGHKGSSIPGLIDDVTPILESENPFELMIQFWGEHIRRYIPWMFSPIVCPVKYEQLVQAPGYAFGLIENHYNRTFGTAEEMMKRIKPHRCETFRKGIVGDWRNHFSPSTLELFMKELGDIMKFWGYV